MRGKSGFKKRHNPYKYPCEVPYQRMEEFLNWLVDRGADVYTDIDFDQHIKFNTNGKIGIVMWTGYGNYIASQFLSTWRNLNVK